MRWDAMLADRGTCGTGHRFPQQTARILIRASKAFAHTPEELITAHTLEALLFSATPARSLLHGPESGIPQTAWYHHATYSTSRSCPLSPLVRITPADQCLTRQCLTHQCLTPRHTESSVYLIPLLRPSTRHLSADLHAPWPCDSASATTTSSSAAFQLHSNLCVLSPLAHSLIRGKFVHSLHGTRGCVLAFNAGFRRKLLHQNKSATTTRQ